jgi:hypothetical protein
LPGLVVAITSRGVTAEYYGKRLSDEGLGRGRRLDGPPPGEVGRWFGRVVDVSRRDSWSSRQAGNSSEEDR